MDCSLTQLFVFVVRSRAVHQLFIRHRLFMAPKAFDLNKEQTALSCLTFDQHSMVLTLLILFTLLYST